MASSKKRKNNGPHIFWRNGRAYADFRSYADVGGERRALAAPGKRWGTTDPEIAEDNANPYDPNSVSDPYGRYGSPYSPESINNPYGRFGSPYSSLSARNPYGTVAPGLYTTRSSYGLPRLPTYGLPILPSIRPPGGR